MKAKYKFTQTDFRRWLKGTRIDRLWQCSARLCLLARFAQATGLKEAYVNKTTYGNDKIKRKDLPIWGKKVVSKFDSYDGPNFYVSASECRKLFL